MHEKTYIAHVFGYKDMKSKTINMISIKLNFVHNIYDLRHSIELL